MKPGGLLLERQLQAACLSVAHTAAYCGMSLLTCMCLVAVASLTPSDGDPASLRLGQGCLDLTAIIIVSLDI